MAQPWLLPVVVTEMGSKIGNVLLSSNIYLEGQPGRGPKGLASERRGWNSVSPPIINSTWFWKLGSPCCVFSWTESWAICCVFSSMAFVWFSPLTFSTSFLTVWMPASGAVLFCLLSPKQVWANTSISLLSPCLWDILPVLGIAGWNLVVLSWTWLSVCSSWLIYDCLLLCLILAQSAMM